MTRGKTGRVAVGPATARQMAFDKKLSIARAQLSWYYSILLWALNRIDSTPAALLSLIRDKANAMRKEFPHIPGEDK